MKDKSKSSKLNAKFKYSIVNMLDYLHRQIYALNTSKAFAGLMIIVLNISSRFVNIKLSRSIESYLKYTFSRQVLIFAITWMGTRDIYIAFIFSLVFIICVDFLFNEDSRFCCLPSHFTDYHIQLLETSATDSSGNKITTPNASPNSSPNSSSNASSNASSNSSSNASPKQNATEESEFISEDQIKKAKEVLEKAKRQNAPYQYQGFYNI